MLLKPGRGTPLRCAIWCASRPRPTQGCVFATARSVLKAERRRRVEQVRVVNSDAFGPNRDGLMMVTDFGLKPLSDWDRLTNFAWIIGKSRR